MITFIKSRILQNPAIPCLPLLIIYILSILPLTLNYLFNISFITLILWIPVFAFFKMKLIPLNHLVIIISVGLISSYLNCTSHKDHISNFVGSSKTYLTVKGTITNVHFPNKILQWNAKTPKFILEITEISLKNETERAKGRVFSSKFERKLSVWRFSYFNRSIISDKPKCTEYFHMKVISSNKISVILYTLMNLQK